MEKAPDKIYLQCLLAPGTLLDILPEDIECSLERVFDNDAVYVLEEARQRDRDRCKRAGRLVLDWRNSARGWKDTAKYVTRIEQRTGKARAIDRQRLRRVLGMARFWKGQWDVASDTAIEERDELRRRLDEAQEILRDARQSWASPNTNPLDVLESLAAALRGGEGE